MTENEKNKLLKIHQSEVDILKDELESEFGNHSVGYEQTLILNTIESILDELRLKTKYKSYEKQLHRQLRRW